MRNVKSCIASFFVELSSPHFIEPLHVLSAKIV